MRYKVMDENDIKDTAQLYLMLLNHVQCETGDDYFSIETTSLHSLATEIAESLKDKQKITFIAKQGERVVGFISGEIKDCFLPISKVKQIGYISGAFVLTKFRRKDILKNLEKLLIEYFKSLGLTYTELNVMTENISGKKSWQKLGYSTFREQMRKKI